MFACVTVYDDVTSTVGGRGIGTGNGMVLSVRVAVGPGPDLSPYAVKFTVTIDDVVLVEWTTCALVALALNAGDTITPLTFRTYEPTLRRGFGHAKAADPHVWLFGTSRSIGGDGTMARMLCNFMLTASKLRDTFEVIVCIA
jgi:hypothetical protein